jgi:hypothetical protein
MKVAGKNKTSHKYHQNVLFKMTLAQYHHIVL